MISLKVDGFEGVIATLTKLSQAIDPVGILDEAGAVILNRIRTRFLAEEGPDGPWIPSAAGIKRKGGGYTYKAGRRYSGTGTLFESGILFHSIQLHTVGPESRAISSDVPYGVFHQYGTARLPARPFLGFNGEDGEVATRVVLRRVKEALGG